MSANEKRRSMRRPILDTFSMAVVVESRGDLKLKVHDISDHGLGFDIDIEGEELSVFSPKIGETHSIRLYLNQSLFIPLKIKVARLDKRGSNRVAGVEIQENGSKNQDAFLAFIKVIDALADVGKIQK